MVKLLEKKDEITGETSLELDKRTLSKVDNPPNVKTLKYSRHLPIECNGCPFRPKEEGGNGLCNKYEEDAVCVIRKDIAKMVDKFDERNAGRLLGMLESAYENNFEKLIFFEDLENMSGALDPEVTKRMNATTNMAKIISEMKTKKESIEITKTHRLTDNMKEEIAQTIKLEQETIVD